MVNSEAFRDTEYILEVALQERKMKVFLKGFYRLRIQHWCDTATPAMAQRNVSAFEAMCSDHTQVIPVLARIDLDNSIENEV